MNNYYLICTLLHCALFQVSIYGANFEADQFHLGSKTFLIGIGTLQERYLPLTIVDELASKNARILIELLRPMFPTGITPMPRLDPYRLRNLSTIIFDEYDLHLSNSILKQISSTNLVENVYLHEFNLDGNAWFCDVILNPTWRDIEDGGLVVFNAQFTHYRGRVDIRNLTIIGAKTFHINLLEIRMKNLRIDFGLTIPVLKGAVAFDGNLHLGGFFPMNTQGRMRIIIGGLSVIGAVQLKEKDLSRRNFYSIQALHAEVHADDIKVQFLDTNLSGILQQMISSDSYELPPNLYFIIEKVKDYLTSEILKQGNDILKGLTVDEVKAYLLSDLSLPS